MGMLAGRQRLGPDALRRAVIHGSVMASSCLERFRLDCLRALIRAEIHARFEQFRALTRR